MMSKKGDNNGFWACVVIVVFAILLALLIYHVASQSRPKDRVEVRQHQTDAEKHSQTKAKKEPVVKADELQPAAGVGSVVEIEDLEVPYFSDDEYVVVCEEGDYVFHYNTTYLQSDWVAYLLTRSDVVGQGVDRSDRFIADDKVKEKGWDWVTTSDYTNSGYDRGHLCPSADRNDTEIENRATFYMSNISPQTPSLNRGVWKELEEQVREWAARYDSLYIVTGGVLNEDDLEMFNGIGVPKSFYKVIMAYEGGEWQSCGFLMPNIDNVEGEWSDYAVAVDEIEQVTGFDFYSKLSDGIEGGSENKIGAIFK